MTVSSILKNKGREVVSASPTDSVAQAISILGERRIGALIIQQASGALAGILSERDVVRAIARHGASALDHPIALHMTAKVETAREADLVPTIMERMTAGKFRHMPVVEGARVVGMVSIGDVVKHRLAEMEAETQAMREYITA
jgi:CBS domain-containing protein